MSLSESSSSLKCVGLALSLAKETRFIYTGATGKIGTNEAAVDYWIRHYPNNSIKNLVQASFKWRTNFSEAEASKLLPKNLLNIYQEFIRRYTEHCLEYGANELAEQLKNWKLPSILA